MKKVILIVPPSPAHKRISRFSDCSQEAKSDYLYQPTDFMIITSFLEAEDKVVFIDGTADFFRSRNFLIPSSR